MLQHLAQQVQGLGGEMMLGQLIDAAREQLTELNYPEGNCCFCLEPLLQPGWSPAQLVEDLLKLPCFHCFHRWGAVQLERFVNAILSCWQ